MSGYIDPDNMSTSPDKADFTVAFPGDPGKPILDTSSSSSNYSSINHRKRDVTEENANAASNIRGPTYSYEELSSGLTCPTCQGTGKIPRGQESDLVALIPYGDKRLKPRRTWLYVILSVSFCIVIAGVLCAFLIPRTIEVVHDNVTTLYADLNLTEDWCYLSLESCYNVTNNNFVSVKANDIQLQVTVLFHGLQIMNRKFVLNEQLGIRTTGQIRQLFNLTLTNKYFPLVYCKPSAQHDNFSYMKFQTTFNFTRMTQTDQQVVTEYFRVNCSPNPEGNGRLMLLPVSKEEAIDDIGQEKPFARKK